MNKDIFIANGVQVVGDVSIGQGSSIWFNAVLRGDMSYIKVGEHSNIQDNATLHVDTDFPTIVGDYVTIGHNAVVHGCFVEDNCLIGIGSTILNGAVIGKNSIIGANALITENTKIPANSLAVGVPAKVIRTLTDEEVEYIKYNAERYEDMWREEYK